MSDRAQHTKPEWQQFLLSSNGWNRLAEGQEVSLTDDSISAPLGAPNAAALEHAARVILGSHGFKVIGGSVPALQLRVSGVK